MIRSFYIAGTGMMTQRSKMDVIINNVTNIDTVGYKQDQLVTRSFEDLLLDRLNDPSIINRTTYVGPQNTGVHVDEMVIDFQTGAPQETGEMTDLAIQGEGFFTVETPDGVQYTRAGDFWVDQNGNMMTQEGYYVLGQGGGRLNVGTEGFVVATNGTIQNMQGQQIGALQIVTFENLDVLRKTGNNNFIPYDGSAPAAAQNTEVKQGYVEGSNVDTARVMSDLLMTNRVYEASQRMLQMVDSSLEKKLNKIGSF
jgi:flagellar basal-body rod protein FlgG